MKNSELNTLLDVNLDIQKKSIKFRSEQEDKDPIYNPVMSFKLYHDGCYILQYADYENVFYNSLHKMHPYVNETNSQRTNYSPESKLIFVSTDRYDSSQDLSEQWTLDGESMEYDYTNNMYYYTNFGIDEHIWQPQFKQMQRDSQIFKKMSNIFPLAQVQHFGEFVAILKENMFFHYNLQNLYNAENSLFPTSYSKIKSDLNKRNDLTPFNKYYYNQYLTIIQVLNHIKPKFK